MIIKLKSHKRPIFKQILEYMLGKDSVDKDGKSFVLTHNLKGKKIDAWVKQFKANEEFRERKRIDSVKLTHEILSWHRDDAKNITPEKLEEIARQYLQLRNPKGMYVAVPHFDKEHYHIHICASGVEYKTGKSLRLAKVDLQKLKKDIQQFQVERFPELSKSIVEHGKKEKSLISEKEYQLKLRTGRESHKSQLIGMLKTCYKKANSQQTFFELLKDSGLKTYDRSGKTTGVVFKNFKFRFNRLGFTQDRIMDLDKSFYRGRGLKELREKKEEKSIDKNKQVENDKATERDIG